ncbi:MAG: PEP-CTERM sorting domain-containing protein [Phycisphaerales bacterium]|nr:PEP-CTERM sorting domain-containing protein [Phycisphaerales bacterium]
MRLALGAAVVALAGTAASASSLINIDFGTQFGTPGAGHGAAAAQPGIWNAITATTGSVPLNDIAGAPSGASIALPAGNFAFSFNNAGTSGDFEALLDDGLDLGAAPATDTFVVTGLAAGNYQVYVYAWAPDSTTFITSTSVNGSPGATSGGAFGGNYAAGITHNVFNVTLSAGQPLNIMTTTISGFATLNGIQIVPSPGAMALLGMGGLAAARRRR